MQSERAKLIDAYIQEHPDAEVGNWQLVIGGTKEILPYYKFPIKSLLCYNINNGRFSMEKQQWESDYNRKLDSTNEDDEKIITQILTDIDKDKTKLLKDDIKKNEQMEPGVISHDGFVINGNRRMAILMQLHEENSSGKWEYLQAVRLPSSVSERDLWRIEAGLQLSMGKVLDYHPVNVLLKIKQGYKAGLKPKEIAAALYGRTEDWVKESLKRLQLIDQFISFFGKNQNYGLIETYRLSEHFIDIQKSIISSKSKYNVKKKDIQKRIEYTFALIRASILNKKNKSKSITHMDIRRLGKIFANLNAEETFLTNLKDAKDSRKIEPDIIIDDFQNAVEVLKNQADKDEPVKLINRALKALENIDTDSKHFKEEKVKSYIIKLSECVRKLEKILEIELVD